MSPNTLLRIPILMLENMKLKMKKSIQQKWYRFANERSFLLINDQNFLKRTCHIDGTQYLHQVFASFPPVQELIIGNLSITIAI